MARLGEKPTRTQAEVASRKIDWIKVREQEQTDADALAKLKLRKWKQVVADVETDEIDAEGNITVVHSLVIRDRFDRNVLLSCANDIYGYPSITEGLDVLANVQRVFFHNGIKFDYRALRRVYPKWDMDREKITDTLVGARLVFIDQKKRDYALAKEGLLPGHLIGRHSLEAWGYRLRRKKGDFQGPWDVWCAEMQRYCERDTLVTRSLVRLMVKRGIHKPSMKQEMRLAWYLAEQERNGVPFNMEGARALQGRLADEREISGEKLRRFFGTWIEEGKKFTPKRDNKRYGYKAGVECTKLVYKEFNPASRPMIANRLTKVYGWKPKKFTDNGQAEISADTLKGLTFPEAPTLLRYLRLTKMLGTVAEGQHSWITNAVERNGRWQIHHAVNQSGAITHRAAHSHPNLGQVPKVGKPWGEECRALFYAPPGWTMVGADASGLELRCLGHHMTPWDDGVYGAWAVEGAVHAKVQALLGITDRSDIKGYDITKTFEYAHLYGAGNAKLGRIVRPGLGAERSTKWGKMYRDRYEGRMPALKFLLAKVQKEHAELGYVTAIDGRKIYTRSEHSALNSQLQGDGAIVVKYWMIEAARQMEIECGPQGWDNNWVSVLWVHDEEQWIVRDPFVDQAKDILVRTMPTTGLELGFRLPLAAEAKSGRNWAETH